MADIKELKNQDLIMAYHLMQYNATPERQAEFMQEVVKARFLAPASFDPEPETGAVSYTHLTLPTNRLV